MSAKTYRTGQFVWRELMTGDVDQARRFYGELFGWTFEDVTMPDGMIYTMIKLPTGPIGGLMKFPPGAPEYPAWTSSVSVADVDATARLAEQNGGGIAMGPIDAGGMGRYAVLADPTGAVLALWHANEGDSPAVERPPVGSFCWESCNSVDPPKAKAFYQATLGWREVDGPVPGMGVLAAGDVQVADVNPAPPGVPSHWLTHVVVEELAVSRPRAEKLGATIMMPDVAVPKVGHLCIIQDPAGAVISLFEPERR